ncbi:MAG: TenA family protein [Bdellovibrionota bacterium]
MLSFRASIGRGNFRVCRQSFSNRNNLDQFSFFAWKQISPIYNEIKELPFNQQLASGTLDPKIFEYYSSQDAPYLDVYSKVLHKLSSLLPNEKDKNFVRVLADGCLDEKADKVETKELTSATLNYIYFFKNIESSNNCGEISAAVLICLWIYHRLACDMRSYSSKNNPYDFWSERYSRPEFKLKVDFMRELTDRLFMQSSDEERRCMLAHFVTTAKLEYDFFKVSYIVGGNLTYNGRRSATTSPAFNLL